MVLNLFFYLIIFLFGLVVGSFLNCIIYRLKTGVPHQLLFKSGGGFSRSCCPYCKHKLAWQDLIPLLSFLILGGKCRYCHQKISWQYPLVELATGILFLSALKLTDYTPPATLLPSAVTSDGPLYFYYLLIIICFLIIIFVYDLKHYIIPDKVIYPAIGIVFIYNIIIRDPALLMRSGLVAILAAAFFLSIVLVSQGKWMGLGDVKLAFFMGLFLGWPNILVALFLAFFIGAIIGIGLVISGKKTLRSEVPFGPFLVSGTFLALFFGQNIVSWYFSLFLL